ncbi:MAG TPA: hypothetical protein DCG75_00710 [Bacteroidales bacterium]|nr:hypothetical protein [Bacteroidales bacterium]
MDVLQKSNLNLKNQAVFRLIKSLPKLTRLGISVAVSFSAATGYLVANKYFDSKIIFVVLGVLLFASGASALNQYQERNSDALMLRTQNRPIPSKQISPALGLTIAIVFSIAGFLILYIKTGYIPALLGILNILWYNGLYTYLKKKTAFAVVPGSLTGVTPVLIGWTAAGGFILNPVIIFISFFIYMWQIPHFWLILIKYNDDYLKAGFGSLSKTFSGEQIKRIVFNWVLGTSITSLFLPYYGIIQSLFIIILLLIANFWIIVSFYKIIFNKRDVFNFKKAFISINVFMILVMILLIIDSVLL